MKYALVKDSKIHGKGVFAKTNIKKGTKIIEYVGRKITKKQADRLYQATSTKEEENNKQLTTYIFDLDKKYDIDGNVSWNPARFINHSCEPNCETINEDGHIWIIALRNIKKGQELSYDYGYPLQDYEDHPCRCGAKTCPGFIVPEKDRKKLKQKLKPKRVLLGLSGGVDSAVAALILKKQGYEVIGAFIKCFSRRSSGLTGKCLWRQDIKYAKKIAKKLGIFLVVFNFEREYQQDVIKPMFQDYKTGKTPNPDALCNKKIKFPLLWEQAKKFQADYIATGHYIKKITNKNKYELHIPDDKNKDQSYFLYDLAQKDLKHSLFPIGQAGLTKEQVRQIAKKHKFPNYDKPGTRGLCFIGKMNMKSFLEQKIKPKPGKILNPQGEIIGQHPGIAYYTIGQRATEGLKIDKEHRNRIKKKLYILEKNRKTNTLIIGPKNHPLAFKNQFQLVKTNFISPVKFPIKAKVRIRHLGKLHEATIKKRKNKIQVNLKKPISEIASGQSCVIYQGKHMLGGGEIRLQ